MTNRVCLLYNITTVQQNAVSPLIRAKAVHESEQALWCTLAAVLCSKLVVIPGTILCHQPSTNIKTSSCHEEVNKRIWLWDNREFGELKAEI